MRRGFSRSRAGVVRLRLDGVEAQVVADLVAQLREMVAPEPVVSDDPLAALVGIDPAAEVPDDPALLRLFPQAYPDDADASADFRRFTERGLREGKAANADAVLAGIARLVEGGGSMALESGETRAWLGCLNDLRLVLAERIGVDDDEGAWRAGLDDELEGLASVYDWLTWLQDGLLDALVG